MKTLTASDRSALIRLASSLPVGDENRRTILAGLAQARTAAGDVNVPGKHILGNARVSGDAHVFGDAKVYGNAEVGGDANVFGNAEIGGTAILLGGKWDGSEGPIIKGRWKGPGIPA